MAKKEKRSNSKNRDLHEAVKRKIAHLEANLGILYMNCPDLRNTIHETSKGIRDLKEIFSDLLFHVMTAQEILKYKRGDLNP